MGQDLKEALDIRFGSWLCENALADALKYHDLSDLAEHDHFA
jgi:hypothetical protein